MDSMRRTSTNWNIRPGEALSFETLGVSITLIQKSGQHARLHVVAPLDVSITKERGNLHEDGTDHVPSMGNSIRS